MTEWRLFPEGTVPDFTLPEFFESHGWIAPEHQMGHAERTRMAADMIAEFVTEYDIKSIVDLGSGDGSLLGLLSHLDIPKWGYDAGRENVEVARLNGVDVRQLDLLSGTIEYGELVVATEMIEHLYDPHTFVRNIPGNRLVLTSPSAETADWHYYHHAWAWDLKGYRKLVEDAGWTVVRQTYVDAPGTFHCGEFRPQQFQGIAAIK